MRRTFRWGLVPRRVVFQLVCQQVCQLVWPICPPLHSPNPSSCRVRSGAEPEISSAPRDLGELATRICEASSHCVRHPSPLVCSHFSEYRTVAATVVGLRKSETVALGGTKEPKREKS